VLLQLDETIDKNRLRMFPLASYAAQHWVNHAKFKGVALQISDAMELLFNPKKPYLAAWLGYTIWIRLGFYRSLTLSPMSRHHPRQLRCTMQRYVVSLVWWST